MLPEDTTPRPTRAMGPATPPLPPALVVMVPVPPPMVILPPAPVLDIFTICTDPPLVDPLLSTLAMLIPAWVVELPVQMFTLPPALLVERVTTLPRVMVS